MRTLDTRGNNGREQKCQGVPPGDPGRKKWPGQRREAEPAGHVPLYSSSVEELRSPGVAELLRRGRVWGM